MKWNWIQLVVFVVLLAPAERALAGPCAGSCGEQSPQGCYCDDVCASQGDCCEDVCADCGESLSFCEGEEVPVEEGEESGEELFQCANGEQIVAVLVCNGIPNCWDGSDEQNCGEEEGGESWEEEGGEVAEEEGGESWEEEGGEGESTFGATTKWQSPRPGSTTETAIVREEKMSSREPVREKRLL